MQNKDATAIHGHDVNVDVQKISTRPIMTVSLSHKEVFGEMHRAFLVKPLVERAEARLQEQVKLVIWDLDDTFWNGTLAEGGAKPIEANMQVVRTLNQRGIVNAICSKNDFERAKAELISYGIWDQFIFPSIAFEPKGEKIRDIIDAAQLRAPSVLFIDDNPSNIQEALHYNPGIQVCEPEAISGLLDDTRCKGKPDPQLTRLLRYRVLEAKFLAKASAGLDNTNFLRDSGICLSFHYDIKAEFPRIHDLVNRSNQLNFTKRRWPEDLVEAEAVFDHQLSGGNSTNCGYVKVSDRFGNYGIVGFFMIRLVGAVHFLFSCRILNMGIEQFVWQKTGRPKVQIKGEVASKLGSDPDWITVVDDADALLESTSSGRRKKVCLRGACDLGMMSHYIRTRYDTIEEFNYPMEGWDIHPVSRSVVLHEELKDGAGTNFLSTLPLAPLLRCGSTINTGEADVYVLSFTAELYNCLYRSKSSSTIISLVHHGLGDKDITKVDRQKLSSLNLSSEQLSFLQNDLVYIGGMKNVLFVSDLRAIFKMLRGKTIIVLKLSTHVGPNKHLLSRWDTINEILLPIAHANGAIVVDIGDYVTDGRDIEGGNMWGIHYRREIYERLAKRIMDIIESLPFETIESLPLETADV